MSTKSDLSASVRKIVEAFEQFEARRADFALVSRVIDQAVALGVSPQEWNELNDWAKEGAIARIKRRLGKEHPTRIDRFVREGFAWCFEDGIVTTYVGAGDGLVPDRDDHRRMIHVDETVGPEPHPLLMVIVRRLWGIKEPDPDAPPGNIDLLRFTLQNWSRQGQLYQESIRTTPELQAQLTEAMQRYDQLTRRIDHIIRGEGFEAARAHKRLLDEAENRVADLHIEAVKQSSPANPEADRAAESLQDCCENVLDDLDRLEDPAFPIRARVHMMQQIVQAGELYATLQKTKDIAVLAAYRNGLRLGQQGKGPSQAVKAACEALFRQNESRPEFPDLLPRLEATKFRSNREEFVRFGEFPRVPLKAIRDAYSAWCKSRRLPGRRGRPRKPSSEIERSKVNVPQKSRTNPKK